MADGDLASEDALAARIAAERRRRGMSQEQLASAVEEILGGGFPQSAISKIERPRGRRAITVDEALAFSRVLQIPLVDLMLPAAVALTARVREAVEQAAQIKANYDAVGRRLAAAIEELTEVAREHPEAVKELRILHAYAKENPRNTLTGPVLELMFGTSEVPPNWQLTAAVTGMRRALLEGEATE